ncbi:MAG: hypothetical protein NVS2B9_07170 [Myxococcales bacterium]
MAKVPSLRILLRRLGDDLDHFCRVYDARTRAQRLGVALEPRFWCLVAHRFGQWVYGPQPGLARPLLKAVFHLLDTLSRIAGRCQIEVGADLGERCFLSPYGNLFIVGPIGDDVAFHGDVTVGFGGRGARSGAPVVAARVSLGPGATLVGPLRVGEGVAVGANAVAASDLASAGSYAGAPARRQQALPPEACVPLWSPVEETPMTREPFWSCFLRDVDRHCAGVQRSPWPSLSTLRTATTTAGIWACLVYRLQRAVPAGPSWLRAVLLLSTWPLQAAVRLGTGIVLDRRARIGAGFFVGHFGSIYVGPGVRIGAGCNIGQNCFLGRTEAGAPRVGDRVYVGVGAKILGPVEVGDDAAIGANAVPFADVPAMAVVVGNPARIISRQGSTGLLEALPHDGPQPALSVHAAGDSRARA